MRSPADAGVSLEAVRPHLSTGLPLSAGSQGKRIRPPQDLPLLSFSSGGPTSMTLPKGQGFSLVALRLRLSADLPCTKVTSRKTLVVHIEPKKAKKIHKNVVPGVRRRAERPYSDENK